MRTPLLPGLAALLLALLVLNAATDRHADAAPEGTAVTLRTLDLAGVDGTLVALNGTHVTLRDAAGTSRRFDLATCIALHLPEEAARRTKGIHVRAWLTGGSRVAGRIAGGSDDVLVLESEALGTLEVLLDHIRTLEALPAGDSTCHDLAAKHPRPEGDDLAYDADGDEYRGAALEVDDAGVLIETTGKRERTVPWKALRVLHLENNLLDAPAGRQTEVELQDGSRLNLAGAATLENGALTFALRALPKKTLRVPLAHVRHVRWRGDRFVYASDLPFESKHELKRATPPGTTYASAIARWMGARVDRRSDGCPLRIEGVTYRHGFGVNSRSTVTIPLEGAYASLRGAFGIDDSVKQERYWPEKRGHVDGRVIADGKVLWEAKGVVGGTKARTFGPLDVRGVKVLVLEVGFGDDSGTLDRANWVDPILVKSAE